MAQDEEKQTNGLEDGYPQVDFDEIPVWSHDAKFELTGKEFEILFNFVNMFGNPVHIGNAIFARHVSSGVITMDYKRKDGTPVSPEEIKEFTAKLNAYYAKLIEQGAKEQISTTEPVIATEPGNPA